MRASFVLIAALAALLPLACDTAGDDTTVDGDTATIQTGSSGTATFLTYVEDDLLAAINDERADAGLPLLTREPGLDQVVRFAVYDMQLLHRLGHIDSNERGAEERARYYGSDAEIRCSEIVQWWGGRPSGRVQYEGYYNSPPHHSAYMEEGIYNLGPTTHAGVAVMSGKGPTASEYADRDGAYSAVMICDQPLTLAIDPFSEL